jgi:hypothetical protein
MKNILITVCFFLGTYYLISCTKGGNQDGFNGNIYTISATANSKLLIPPIDTTSTGILSGLYDEQANNFTYTIAWNYLWRDSIYNATTKKNIATTAAQKDALSYIKFYSSSAITDSGTLVRSQAVTNTNRNSNLKFCFAGYQGLTAAEKADLYAGKWYIVLATKKYPNGIINF